MFVISRTCDNLFTVLATRNNLVKNTSVSYNLLACPPCRYYYLSSDVSDPEGPKTYKVERGLTEDCCSVQLKSL